MEFLRASLRTATAPFEPDHGRIPGHRRSWCRRKLVEELCGWMKTIGAGGKMRDFDRARNNRWFALTANCNLIRLAYIEPAAV